LANGARADTLAEGAGAGSPDCGGNRVEDQFKEWWLGPKAYKIYLVGSLTGRETERIFRGFQAQHELLTPKIGDVPVEISVVDDLGTSTGANGVSRIVSHTDDALLVVGHVISTDTIAALPNYIGSNPPVPVITTRETSADLQCPREAAYCPVLRMSPSDVDQARDLVRFAVEKKPAGKFAVVAGDINSGYTRPLADLLAKQVTEKRLAMDLFRSRSEIPPRQFVNGRYDCVLVAGEAADAKSLVARIKEEYKNSAENAIEPIVFLSDASFDQTLLMGGGGQLMDGVTLTYQLGRYDEDQPYHAYGLDAFDLASALISMANGRVLNGAVPWSYRLRRSINMHRVADARSILLQAIYESFNRHLEFLSGSGELYKFDSDGHRLNGRFHMWQVKGSKLVDVDGERDLPAGMQAAESQRQPPHEHLLAAPFRGPSFPRFIAGE